MGNAAEVAGAAAMPEASHTRRPADTARSWARAGSWRATPAPHPQQATLARTPSRPGAATYRIVNNASGAAGAGQDREIKVKGASGNPAG
jgi:hypothetical protein